MGGPGTATTPTGMAERMMAVVEAVVDAGAPVGPRGLARTTGIDRSAVGRILQQLEELDVLERVPDGYRPGPRLFALGRVLAALDTLPDVVRPILESLVDTFDETCYVCALHGDVAVFIHEIQSAKPLRFVVELGMPVPLHAGAAGRAILTGLPPEEASALLGAGPLEALTPATITDRDHLLDVAEADRRRGYSVSLEERVPGGASVAAPFFDQRGRCQGSVVFTTPLSRLDRARLDEIGMAVRDAADTLSNRLGATARRKSEASE